MTSLQDLAGGRSVEEAISDAIAELSAGLPSHLSHQLARDKKQVASILHEARTSQLPLLARRLAAEPLAWIDAADTSRAVALSPVARDASNDLIASLSSSGRVLARFRNEKVRIPDAPLFSALIAMAEAEAARSAENRPSGRMLAPAFANSPRPTQSLGLGPVLTRMWTLTSDAGPESDARAHRFHLGATEFAQELRVDFVQELENAGASLSARVDLSGFLSSALKAGARRLAFLDGVRARP